MAEKIRVSFYVAAPLAKAVRLLAAHEERSQSDVVVDALEEYLSARQEHLDWMRAAEPTFTFWQNEADAAYDAL